MNIKNFYRFYIGAFVFIVVGSVVAGATILQTPQVKKLKVVAECNSVRTTSSFVGGLGLNVPRLPTALRLNYNVDGGSQYTVKADTKEVLNYYLSALAADCWKLMALKDNGGVWVKDDNTVRLAVQTNSLSGKSVVDYENLSSPRVLGTTVNLAQATDQGAPTNPPPSGTSIPPSGDNFVQPPTGTQPPLQPQQQPYQPNSFNYPAPNNVPPGNNFVPPPTGTQPQPYPNNTQPYQPNNFVPPPMGSQPQPPQQSCGTGQIWCGGFAGMGGCYTGSNCPNESQPKVITCSEGQFSCNDKCVPSGTSCNNMPYYAPGTQPPQYPDKQNQPPYQGLQPQQNNFFPGSNQGQQFPNKTNQPFGKPQQMNNQNGQFGNNQGQEGFDQPDQQQQMDAQRFEQMKQGLNQFAKGVKQMNSAVARFKKQLGTSVAIPAELVAALEKAPDLIQKIKDAKTVDELDAVIEDVQDVGATMQDWGPRLGDLQRLAQMLKQSVRDQKNIDRNVNRLQLAAKRNSQIVEVVANLVAKQTVLKQTLSEATTLAQTDPDGALDKLENDYYGGMEEFFNEVQFIDMVQNLKKGLTQATNEIKRADKSLIALSKSSNAEEDALVELKSTIADVKQKLAEVKQISQTKPVDQEALRLAAEDLWQGISDMQNMLSETGTSYYLPQVKSGPNVQFQLPQGFSGGGMGPNSTIETPDLVTP